MGTFKLFNRILFNLEFALSGYIDDAARFIHVSPDEHTNKLFSKYHITFRKYKNAYLGLIEVLTEAPDVGKPRIEIKQNETFRFQVKILDMLFFARTHLYTYEFQNSVLVLSNSVNHIDGADILISQPFPGYVVTGAYEKGHFVTSGGNYYVALLPSNPSDTHPVTEATHWKSVPAGSFVSQGDFQPRSSGTPLNVIMLIDIIHSNNLPVSHQLLDASSKCKEISYKIKLLNKQ